MNLRRIIPTTIPGLYKKHGMNAVSGRWLTGENLDCGCLTAMLLVDAVGHSEAATLLAGQSGKRCQVIADNTGFDEQYVNGLVGGFDGKTDCSSEAAPQYREAIHAGFADGAAAYAEVRKAGLIATSL